MIFATGNFHQLCCWNNSTNELFFTCSFQSELFFLLLKMSKVFYRAQTLKSFQPPAFKSSCLQLLSQSHRLHIKYGSMVFLSWVLPFDAISLNWIMAMRPMNPVSDAQMQIPQHQVFGNERNGIPHNFDFENLFIERHLMKDSSKSFCTPSKLIEWQID